MGMYSTNRFSNLTAALEEETKIVIETDEGDVEVEDIPEIDDDVLAMLDDDDDEPSVDLQEALEDLDSIIVEDSFLGLLESSMELTNAEIKMNSAFIESEFLSTAREKELAAIGETVSINEQEEENKKKAEASKNHISKIMAGAKNSVEQAAAKLAAKAEALFKSDKAIYDKYLPYIDKKHLEGFPGIKNFAFPNANASKAANKAVSTAPLCTAALAACKAIKSAKSQEDINKAVSAFNDIASKLNQDSLADILKVMEKSENWVPSGAQIGYIKSFAKVDHTKAAIAKTLAVHKKWFEETGNKLIATAIELSNDELAGAKEKALCSVASSLSKACNRRFNVYKSLIARELAAVRKAVIICGKYGMKKSSVNESVIENICESSDAYIFEYFED